MQSLIGLKSDHYTAVIIEDAESYIGREVCAMMPVSFSYHQMMKQNCNYK